MQDKPVFEHKLTVPFQDVDAAGAVFYAHLFRYAHEAYEHVMQQIGYSLHELLAEGKYLLPLVHAEADYRRPLRHADKLHLELRLKRLGQTSFTLGYRILGEDQTERASLETVHVVLDRTTQRPLPLPDSLRDALHRLIPHSGSSPDRGVEPYPTNREGRW
jgi:YbgC/YbaW family acyl-CoA thioester hydrolase